LSVVEPRVTYRPARCQMYTGNELSQLLRFKIFLLLSFRGLLINTLLWLQNTKKVAHAPLKHWWSFSSQHCVTSQETWILNLLRTWQQRFHLRH